MSTELSGETEKPTQQHRAGELLLPARAAFLVDKLKLTGGKVPCLWARLAIAGISVNG